MRAFCPHARRASKSVVGRPRVIGTAEARAWLGRRGCLARVVAAGGVAVLAGCGAASTENGRSAQGENGPAKAATTPPPVTSQAKRGNTLTAIARFFGVSSAAIDAANQLGGGDRLTEGQVLQIPPSPPAGLNVTPPDGIGGMVFTFTVTGAEVGEAGTFPGVAPGGGTFTGSPHTAAQDGTVTASYRTDGDAAGKYDVV